MRIALINIPFEAPWLGPGRWVTVPPQGYGGIQWMLANLIDGLIELGHEIYLLGAPGSASQPGKVQVVDCGEPKDIRLWLTQHADLVDVVHDHSCGMVFDASSRPRAAAYLGTHHLNGRARYPRNPVFLSNAQREKAGCAYAPVIRIGVNPARYFRDRQKEKFLLFLGRISRWKGAIEAAEFAAVAGRKLMLAGPSWEPEYRDMILKRFRHCVCETGAVTGDRRSDLLAKASATLVLSQGVPGPCGDLWSEPGATVVSESAASGTPIIATDNGCLPEIASRVGVVIPCGAEITPTLVERCLRELPAPAKVHEIALREWHYLKIAAEHVSLYQAVADGAQW